MDATIWHALTLVGIAVVLVLLLVLGSRLTRVQRRLNDLTHEVRRERKPRRAARGAERAARPAEESTPGPREVEANSQELKPDAPESKQEASGAPEPELKPDETSSARQGQEGSEGQPFERDGRWWFRRGDELLVYDESTGQWLAAGNRQPSGGAADPGTEAGGLSYPGEEDEASRMHYPDEDAGGPFWKCPSCGTVNGSTATSCRMCFAARP